MKNKILKILGAVSSLDLSARLVRGATLATLGLLCCSWGATPTMAQPDVSSSIVDLGDFYGGPGYSTNYLATYDGRVYTIGDVDNDQTQYLNYYTPGEPGYGREKRDDGNGLVINQEETHGLYVLENELLISGADGVPNVDSGVWVKTGTGWKHKASPVGNGLDPVHYHGQYKYKGKYFASFSNSIGAAGAGAATAVSSDNLQTWQIVGDPLGQFVTPDANGVNQPDDRDTKFYFELQGHLFATGFTIKPDGVGYGGNPRYAFVSEKWLMHYTGDANNSFEVVHNTPSDLLSGFSASWFTKAVDLPNGKSLIADGSRVIRVGFVNATGANGTYPKPVGEGLVPCASDAYLVELYAVNGVAYVLESNSKAGTAKIKWSTDGTNWTTLCTYSKAVTGFAGAAMTILNGDIYLGRSNHIYRLPGSAVTLPANNTAPVAADDSYTVAQSDVLEVSEIRNGVLSNDSDPNRDPINAQLVSGPTHGTLSLARSGTFVYTPNSGFLGTDSFAYQVTDGLTVSPTAQVTLRVTPQTGNTGTGTGLSGEYFDNMDFTASKGNRVDSTVDFNWGGGYPSEIGITDGDTFSVRWTGEIQPRYSESYTFSGTSDNGFKLWIDANGNGSFEGGELLVNYPTTSWGNYTSSSVALTAGQKYKIKIDYTEEVGGAAVNFKWQSDSQSLQIVPATQLYPAAPTSVVTNGTGTGLSGEYFDNMDFTNSKLKRTDATINFDWGSGSPDPNIDGDTFSVRWMGEIEPRYSETYTFSGYSDNGFKLWIDANGNGSFESSELLVNQPTSVWQSYTSTPVALTAGQKYKIKIDYTEEVGGAAVNLQWQSSSQALQIVPATQLYPAAAPVSITDGAIYELEPQCAPGTRLDVSGAEDRDGANVGIWVQNGNAAQKWQFVLQSSGIYALVPQNATSRRLETVGVNNGGSGANVDIWNDNGSDSRWNVVDVGGGWIELIPQHNTGLRLDVSGGGGSGSNVQVYTSNNGTAQRWNLIPVNGAQGAQRLAAPSGTVATKAKSPSQATVSPASPRPAKTPAPSTKPSGGVS